MGDNYIVQAEDYFQQAINLRADDHQAIPAYYALAEIARMADDLYLSANYDIKALQIININRDYWLTKAEINPLYLRYTNLIKLFSKANNAKDTIEAIFDQLTPLIYAQLDLKDQINYIKLLIEYGSIKQTLIVYDILNERLQYQWRINNNYAAKETRDLLKEFNNLLTILKHIINMVHLYSVTKE